MTLESLSIDLLRAIVITVHGTRARVAQNNIKGGGGTTSRVLRLWGPALAFYIIWVVG